MTRIIADIGSNWFALDDCINSIYACNADIVKFQYFNGIKLYGSDIIMKEMKKEWLPALKNHCDLHGKEFMCSVFSHDDVEYIDKLVNIHKIASAEVTDENLLKAVAATGKPTLLSTGMAGYRQIETALKFFAPGQLTLMYCESEYPSKIHNLDNIEELEKEFGLEVGYSDHSIDIYQTPGTAVRFHEVPYLEKHFGLKRIIDQKGTNDYKHSLNEHEFTKMIRYLKEGHYVRAYDTNHRRVKKGNYWFRPV